MGEPGVISTNMQNAKPLHLVLVHPEIHGNTGNVGRTCLAAGAQLHLVHPLGFSLSDRYLKRAGLDYWQHVKPVEWASWENFETSLPNLGEAFFFSAEGKRDFWDLTYPKPCVLLFGREGGGFSESLRERYRERLVRLPMHDTKVRSINLATSVGIAVYEVLRQWRSMHSVYDPPQNTPKD